MRAASDHDDLDLPPLDGAVGGDEADGAAAEELDEELQPGHDLGDALDDATSEGDPIEEIAVEGAEVGWLVDAEEGGKALDVGAFDVSLSDEAPLLEPEEPELRVADEDLGDSEEVVHSDGGEEGPLADDEELREEDLPALDADDEGDVADESLYEGGAIDLGEELRWDDRAWARAPLLADGGDLHDPDDSGRLVVPGDDAKLAARDATWRRLDEGGAITAAVLVPGDGVIVALDGPDHPMLVRILSDGVARIVAAIDASTADDEAGACRVTQLRWDGGRGCVVASGTFGAQAFRPA